VPVLDASCSFADFKESSQAWLHLLARLLYDAPWQ
jgi:hypothetical protein